jgi:hypothetical protein
MLTDEERLRVYGSAENVAAADRYINDLADSAPPLTPRQKARLRTLIRPPADGLESDAIGAAPSHADRMIAKYTALGEWVEVRRWERVRACVDQAPPLTAALRDQLTVLLRPEPSAAALQPAREAKQARPPAARPLPPPPAAARRDVPERVAKVYIIGSGDDGRVKIGTTVDLDRRHGDISRMSPVPLKLLWSTDGDHRLERALHAEFGSRRLHGEWFDFGDEDPVTAVAAKALELGSMLTPHSDALEVRRDPSEPASHDEGGPR